MWLYIILYIISNFYISAENVQQHFATNANVEIKKSVRLYTNIYIHIYVCICTKSQW